MWTRLALSGVTLLSLVGLPAWASVTVVSSVTGVALETRSGRTSVPIGTQVDNGARILVRGSSGGNNGRTMLRFDNGCEVALVPGQVYTVPVEPPCAPAPGTDNVGGTSLGGVAPAAIGAGLVAAGVGAAIAVSAGNKGAAPLPYISR